MSNMKIRYGTVNDFELLIEGLEEIRRYEHYSDIHAKEEDKLDYKEAIRNKNIRVIDLDGQSAGFLYFKTNFKLMYVKEKFLWVQRIYIKKEFRGKGFARALYEDAINTAKKMGFGKIFCDVYEVNTTSQAIHKKLGFRPIYAIYEKNI